MKDKMGENNQKLKFEQKIDHIILSCSIIIYMLILKVTPTYAADDMWTKASSLMKDVYTKILGISTIAGVVTASIALLMMNFSRSGKTVDESRAWLKRIVIVWLILNGLGFIIAYIAPFVQGGQYVPT